jgi:VIT1/CCC1 family predicted Fe2+/Mn2+ transporter
MKTLYHREEHFQGGNTIRDIVIGMSDGLTVPFALAAGISGAIAETHLVVTAGFAEIAAGSIAMGLGGYLAAKSDAEHFNSEAKREQNEIIPLFPYIMIPDSHTALKLSAAVTLLALFGFGIAKAYFTGVSMMKSGLQTVFVGGMAAGAAYLLAKAIS